MIYLCLFLITSLVFATCLERFKTILSKTLESSSTRGAVVLVSSPELGTLVFASGFADKGKQIKMQEGNNFRIASMSKTFLAVTLLKLAEQNKINLDAKIMDLLPQDIDLNRLPNGKTATVRQLMQMRSGIPNYTNYEEFYTLVDNMVDKRWTPEKCIEVIYDEKPSFAAGGSYEYSNTNYLLLQLIVEKLTGKSYAAAIDEQVLQPLHLNNTFVETPEAQPANELTTHGYHLDGGIVRDVTFYNDGFGMADSGMVSTAADLNVFIQALLRDKTLLTPESLAAMLTLKDDYGLGIYREEVNHQPAWTHNGDSSGFQGQYYYFAREKLIIVVLTNDYSSEIIEGVVSKTLSIYQSMTVRAPELETQ